MLYILRKIIRKLPGIVIKLVPLGETEIISCFQATNKLGDLCEKYGFKNVLLITDETLFTLGLCSKAIDSLKKKDIKYSIFSNISSEPNLNIVDKGRKAFANANAEAIIALGGGAVMDSSKMIAAGSRLKNKKSKSLLKKFLLVKGKTIPMINIPTTAGTGAEMTVAAVIHNQKGEKKCSVICGLDIKAIILDSELTLNSPRQITTACGIDALSHSLEGIISSTKVSNEEMEKSLKGFKLALDYIPLLINDPKNIDARQNMLVAANYGGNAINKQLCGYVHSFAHAIGGKYNIPHGVAIAKCLLPVVNFEKNKCYKQLALISRYCDLTDENNNDITSSDKLLKKIDELVELCSFDSKKGFIDKKDYRYLAREIALDSINYCPPTVMNNKDIFKVLDEINNG